MKPSIFSKWFQDFPKKKNGDAPGPLGDLSDRCWRNSEILFNFIREIPLKFNRNKKIEPEIWPQNYPLGSLSWQSILQKVGLRA